MDIVERFKRYIAIDTKLNEGSSSVPSTESQLVLGQLTGDGILESFIGEGNGFKFFTFSPAGFLILLVLVICVGFIGYPLGKKIWGNRPHYNDVPILSEVDEINSEEYDPK